jgi:hypothetical protein
MQEQNFDILTGYDNEPIIAFHLSSTIYKDDSESQNLDIETEVCDIEILNGLCRQVRNFCRILYSWLLTTWDEFQLFLGANSIIYGKHQIFLPISRKY